MAHKTNGKLSAKGMKKGTKAAIIIVVCLCLIGAVAGIIFSESKPSELTVSQAQSIIDNSYTGLIGTLSRSSAKYVVEQSKATVNSVSYGSNKEIYADCTVTTIDCKTALANHKNDLLGTSTLDDNDRPIVSTKLKIMIDSTILNILKTEAKPVVKKNYKITISETTEGFKLYTSTDMINTCFGGIDSFISDINKTSLVNIAGNKVIVETNLKNGINECIKLNYDTTKPETATGLLKIWNSLVNEFHRNFIAKDYWKYIVSGLGVTVEVACFAVLIGISLGFLTAIIRCTYDKTGKLKVLNKIAQLYLTVFRGTPVVVQLMIIYFVIFMPLGVNKVLSAIICFGVNSGSYVCEIVRGGIMAIDEGQMEAGRSLGFNYVQTMWHIIIPQAFKSVLPALANEFIVLLKETSVVGYIGLNDLTRGGDIIKSNTYSAFMPLIIVAIIYLVMVLFLSKLVGLLERRLRNSER